MLISGLPTYSGPLTCTARKIYSGKVGKAPGNITWYVTGTVPDNTTTTFTNTTADASLTVQAGGPTGSILLGAATTNTTEVTAYKAQQLVIGTQSFPITEAWIGQGVYGSSGTPPADVLLSPSGSQGTDIAGANFDLSSGFSTGAGASGEINLQVTPPGSTGAARNAAVTAVSVANTATTILAGGTLNSDGGAAPTITAGCTAGGGQGVVGTNTAGTITTGLTAATSCTMSFSAAGTFAKAPVCQFTDANGSISPPSYSRGTTSTSSVIIDGAVMGGNIKIDYICVGT